MPSSDLRPFRIEIDESELDDLRDRLARTRWPPEPVVADWSRGVPLDYLRTVAEHWRESFDWRARERELNELPQFVTEIDGQAIHFVHVRSAADDALPLALTHGWPGSFVEFLDVIGPLSGEFHLVVPTLPGFAYSAPLSSPGWDTPRIARAWDELMRRLGYDSYGAHGGDTGSLVSPELGRVAPDRVVGVHVNGVSALPPDEPVELDAADRARLAVIDRWERDLAGYGALQSTRPDTLAPALTDSPVGQLAWILEKFKDWTDPAAPLPEDAVPLDRILTNVSLYWFTRSAGSSANSYVDDAAWRRTRRPRSPVPTGVAVFPMDRSIRAWVEREHTVTRWSEFDRGGHFAAMEVPDLLAADVREFFRSVR